MENYKNKKLPYIDQNENGVPVLYVDGAPFLMIGGELHNSSASSLTYMEKNVWPYLRDLHLNTVLLPVAWECVEPEEGCYEFSLVEGLLRQARKEKCKTGASLVRIMEKWREFLYSWLDEGGL